MTITNSRTGLEIAVIGMAGAFPGASNIDEFWDSLLGGHSTISTLSDEQLSAAGVHPELLKMPNFVKSKGVFPNLEFFDASFFDYTPRDAAMLDPQARALHQCVYHALEDAGCMSEQGKANIGLFAGASGNFVWELETLLEARESSASQFATVQLNDKDFVATRIAYKLNLRGPAVTLHCACSTSLYAIDMACRQLLTGACSVAVAAGSGLNLPHKNGYVYENGMILSPDGTCRPFSDDSNGTVEGNGMGAVVLKPLEDAIRDRDRIYAVIRGTGANNDGARKVGFTAPSVEGQAEAIRRALHMADVEPASISYVEAHGTGTALGDPVEIEGLKKAFRSDRTGFCGIGSLKSNIGHLDTAAGISSFIKTVKAIKHRQIPPSINFRAHNPEIDFANSPFYVVDQLKEWRNPPVPGAEGQHYPLRAGVSSFGIGGTNVHVVLEEAPHMAPSGPGREWQLVCLSALDAAALARQEAALGEHVRDEFDLNTADLAYTLQVGRRNLPERAAIVCRNNGELLHALQEGGEGIRRHRQTSGARLALLFSGQGTQYAGMGLGLYRSEAVYRDAVERCLAVCERLGLSELRALLLHEAPGPEQAAAINRTELSQPALFTVEYAMAQLLADWGLTPVAMIGHSLGEYVAASVAGVMSMEQALELVCARGRLMSGMAGGSMLAAGASADVVRPLLPATLDLAAVNGPAQCTVSGPDADIEAFAEVLAAHAIPVTRLHTSHAFHSSMMEPMLAPFRQLLAQVTLNAPSIAYISNVSGTWITPEEAQDPEYYVRHLRGTVRFGDGARQLLEDSSLVCVEAGPGNVLGAFLKQNSDGKPVTAIATLRHVKNGSADGQYLARALGDIWGAGLAPDWKRYYRNQVRSKLEAPLYPFDKQTFPVGRGDIYRLLEASGAGGGSASQGATAAGALTPDWHGAMLPAADEGFTVRPCLAISEHDAGFKALALVSGLRLDRVRPGKGFKAEGIGQFVANLGRTTDYRRLIQTLKGSDGVPGLFVWLAAGGGQAALDALADKWLRLAMTLRSESPGQLFKCVAFLPHGRGASAAGAAALDAAVRSIRATCPEFELRCVFMDGALGAEERAAFMEREIYDTETGVLLAAYEQQRRLVYGAVSAPAGQARGERWRDKIVGLLAPEGFQTGELATRILEASGAQVRVLPYSLAPAPARTTALALDGERLRAFLKDDQEQDLSHYGLRDFSACHALLDEACTSLAAAYVDPLLALTPGREFTRAELKAALRITDRLEKYVDYLLAMFVEDGVVAAIPQGYRVLRALADLRTPATIRAELTAASPMFTGNMRMLEHCFDAFPQALCEEITPISVLYPNGKNEMMLRAYDGSIQELEEDVIRVVFEKLIHRIIDAAGARPIRILEAGGGFGLTMRRIAPLLRGMQVEYYFTDVGKTFLHEAKEFALREGHDFLTFGTFDITQDPVQQGLEAQSFDLVFAFNVVHATRKLDVTVGNLQRLVKAGGLMCLLERTAVRRYIDLIWGLADGWWHFDDADRTLSPLIGLEQWDRIARRAGFADVIVYPEDPRQRACLEVGIVIAQNGMAPGHTVCADDSAPQWQLSEPGAGDKLDGVIVIEGWNDRAAETYEPFGEGLTQARGAPHAFAGALGQWLERQRPGFASIWSPGAAMANAADQLARCRAATELDRRASAMLGQGQWSRLYLPPVRNEHGMTAAMPDASVLAEALRAVHGALPVAVIAPRTQTMFTLPPPSGAAAQRGASSVASLDGSPLQGQQGYEALLHSLWADLFGIESIGLDEDFFEIGGDSLKVAQLTGELERHGIKLLTNEVFNRPTIRSLAVYLHENRQSEFGQIRDTDALLSHLRDTLGAGVETLTVEHAGKPYQLLFTDADAASILAPLRLAPHLEPHYVLPLALCDAARTAAPGQVWHALGLQHSAAADALEQMAAHVQRSMQRISAQLCAAPVASTFPLSPFQKMFLKEENRFAFYLIDFDEPVDSATLERALTDIVRLQGLMRSKLRRTLLGKLMWDEHAAPEKELHIPLVDLSGYTPQLQGELLEKLMEAEHGADFDAAPGVMFRVALIRFDRRRHTLLFNLDHSIFDNMSGQVLRRQLLNRYRALAAGSHAPMEPVKSFGNYLDQLNRGPQGISKQRLIELFELADYEKAKDRVEQRIVARRQSEIRKTRFTLDLDRYQLSNDEEATWDLTVVLLSCTFARFLEQDAVPLKLVYQGRQYQDLSYFDTLGLFIDVLPLLVRVDRDDPAGMIASIKRKVRFVNRYNVSFMNMLLNLRMRFKWWDVLSPLNPRKLAKTDPMILLNYVGKAEAEYQKVIDFSTRQMEKSTNKSGYASLYTIVTVVDRKILFDVFCNFEKDMDVVHRLFEEEAARLLPQGEALAGVAEAPVLPDAQLMEGE